MLNVLERQQRLNDQPTSQDHYISILFRNSEINWLKIKEILTSSNSGFSVLETKAREEEAAWDGEIDYSIVWEEQESDYLIFEDVLFKVITLIEEDDDIYNTELTEIFTTLKNSQLFSLLFQKQSQSQGNTVEHHIKTVSSLTKTDGLTLYERISLRITALFHDVGKAFDIGSDHLQSHTLISEDIIKRVLVHLKPMIQESISFMAKKGSKNSVSLSEANEQILENYPGFVSQISEVIRLHHLLEKVDKNQIDIEVAASIFYNNNVDPLIFGMFVSADGLSVVPDSEVYAKYLVNNIEILTNLVGLIDNLKTIFNIEYDKSPETVNMTVVQALQELVINLIDKLQSLIIEIKGSIGVVTAEISEATAAAVLGIASLVKIQKDLNATVYSAKKLS